VAAADTQFRICWLRLALDYAPHPGNAFSNAELAVAAYIIESFDLHDHFPWNLVKISAFSSVSVVFFTRSTMSLYSYHW
jgi:hypothetical protein